MTVRTDPVCQEISIWAPQWKFPLRSMHEPDHRADGVLYCLRKSQPLDVVIVSHLVFLFIRKETTKKGTQSWWPHPVFTHKMLSKNPKNLFGQPNNFNTIFLSSVYIFNPNKRVLACRLTLSCELEMIWICLNQVIHRMKFWISCGPRVRQIGF